jgi:hypothetical protein
MEHDLFGKTGVHPRIESEGRLFPDRALTRHSLADQSARLISGRAVDRTHLPGPFLLFFVFADLAQWESTASWPQHEAGSIPPVGANIIAVGA